MEILAPAKVNLVLEVVGRDRGYHLLDSIMCPINLYDRVQICFRGDAEVNVTLDAFDIDPVDNTAYRAAKAFSDTYGGADIKIIKAIPQKAGLGGSSADAAAVLRAYQNKYSIEQNRILDAAKEIGADVPFCCFGVSSRARGRGEILSPVKIKEPLNLVVAMSGQVGTAQCFDRFKKDNPDILSDTSAVALMADALKSGDLKTVGSCMRSALDGAAVAINPDIKKAAEALKETEPLGVTMTGSGGAYVALYKSKVNALDAAEKIKDKVEFAAAVQTVYIFG